MTAGAAPPSPASGTGPGPAPRRRSLLRETAVIAVVALLLSLIIKTFLFQAFFIPSASMEPTLHGCAGCAGDRVMVSKLTTRFGEIQRGDVVVFHDPGGWLDEPVVSSGLRGRVTKGLAFVGLAAAGSGDDLIKRVIGVGGDTVEGRDGVVSVNGVPLDEPYVFPGDSPSSTDFSVTVPEGRLWVMGDHRDDSADSRAHRDLPTQGFVAEDDVVGRAVVVVWPIGRAGTLSRPDTFDQPALSATD